MVQYGTWLHLQQENGVMESWKNAWLTNLQNLNEMLLPPTGHNYWTWSIFIFFNFWWKKNSQASELPNPNPASVCLYIENQKSEPSMTTSYRSNMKNLKKPKLFVVGFGFRRSLNWYLPHSGVLNQYFLTNLWTLPWNRSLPYLNRCQQYEI